MPECWTGTNLMSQPPGKRALITGITGQDGSYLAELLLEKGYEVHGIIRRSASFNTDRHRPHLPGPPRRGPRLTLHYGDLTDAESPATGHPEVKPDEVYNLGARATSACRFDMPIYTAETVAMGHAASLLEAVRAYQQEFGKQIRYYQASSSEMFGKVVETPQTETTPFYPVALAPYACSQGDGPLRLTVNYRESYNMHASCGILFNHESPRRGETFVTRKITRAVGRIKHGLQDKLYLGNLDSERVEELAGFAGDYVDAGHDTRAHARRGPRSDVERPSSSARARRDRGRRISRGHRRSPGKAPRGGRLRG